MKHQKVLSFIFFLVCFFVILFLMTLFWISPKFRKISFYTKSQRICQCFWFDETDQKRVAINKAANIKKKTFDQWIYFENRMQIEQIIFSSENVCHNFFKDLLFARFIEDTLRKWRW